MAKINDLKFKIKNNQLIIDDDVFDLNEILIGEIIKNKDYNQNYSIKLTFKDDMVDKWIILVDYSTNNKAEILRNFEKLSIVIKSVNPNFVPYNNNYFLNLENVDDINVQQNLLKKFVNIKSGNKNYKVNYSKDEYDLLQESFTNLNIQNKGI